ncbi:hypothetical protein ATCC53582_00174 [Novacetimonas hansenii]|nr:hypothetical protein ATCC53582_00174 [Novacetimonas hansenii]
MALTLTAPGHGYRHHSSRSGLLWTHADIFVCTPRKRGKRDENTALRGTIPALGTSSTTQAKTGPFAYRRTSHSHAMGVTMA